MFNFLSNLIATFFYIIFFFVPLFFWPTNFELFEFNKMVLTYAFTVIVTASWLIKMIMQKKIIFRRTIFDIPLLIFLISQLISTLISIDKHTSLLGYYSRFNGGFASLVTYCLLYWTYVSNMDKQKVIKSFVFIFASAILVSLYGILQHFGIDKNLWVQDVQNRVFSSIGQPNWLAAWLVSLMPISLAFLINTHLKEQIYQNRSKFKSYLWLGLFLLFSLTLLYTKSRSGLLGFGCALIIFGAGIIFLSFKKAFTNQQVWLKPLILTSSCLLLLILITGTPWTANLNKLITNKTKTINTQPTPAAKVQGPALETGGSQSSEIRKIVWKGAFDVWRHYPLFGTGVDTFAFAYYNFRPTEHNLVSEWDFLYNKAHNEFLNYAATTGSVGLITYLLLISVFIFYTVKFITNNQKLKPNYSKKKHRLELYNRLSSQILIISLLAGYVSILVTNFFGFSVVIVSTLFFLFPAFSVLLITQNSQLIIDNQTYPKTNNFQKALIVSTIVVGSYLLFTIYQYWYADTLYAKAKNLNALQSYPLAQRAIRQATKLTPKEALFWSEMADININLALSINNSDQKATVQQLANQAIDEADKALSLSPKNLNILRQRTALFLKLSTFNPQFLAEAQKALVIATKLSPTDAKLFYNLGLIYARMGKNDEAEQTLKQTIILKPDYKDARYAYAVLLTDLGKKQEAKEQLMYILVNLAPNDQNSQRDLENLNK